MRNKIRLVIFGVLVAAGFALAPAAFARSHWNVGINIGLPGVSLGYSDCRHCGWGGGYYGYAYAPRYYAPAYYAPAYTYYAPAPYGYGYGYPVRGAVYYSRPVYRGHVYHDRGYAQRARYYDRGGYGYRH